MSDLIRVTLESESLRAGPGEEIVTSVIVQNAGRVVDAYSIDLAGLDTGWYQLSTSSVSLFPGDSAPVGLTIRIPAGTEAIAGPYEFSISAASSVSASEETTVVGSLEVTPSYSFEWDIRPERVAAVTGSYLLSIVNTGNADLTFELEGSDPEGFCRFAFRPPAPSVAPGESVDVEVRVRPTRRRLLEHTRNYELTLQGTIQETNERQSLRVQLDALPRARNWHIPVAVLMLALMALMGYWVNWLVFEKENLTFLRGEKWDDLVRTEPVNHGLVLTYVFELDSVDNREPPAITPIRIRGSASWDTQDQQPPSLAVILRDPHGNCWRPKLLDPGGDPFQFLVFEEGAPCNHIDYGRLLLDNHDLSAPIPASYSAGKPLVRYCVRNQDGNPIAKFLQSGELQTPQRLTEDHSHDPPPSLLPDSDSTNRQWTIYVVNPHPPSEWPTAPEVTLKLKAARSADSGAWKKDATFTVAGLKAPPAEVAEAGLRCLWDDEIEVPANRTGLQHGVIYVRNLEITPRVDDSGEAQDTVPDAQQACPGDLEEAEVSGNQLRWLCGDITWEREEADAGKITASNVFVILRNNQGAEAICWSKFEEQTPADHAGTPFVFDLINGGQPCREDLNSPKQDLWNLMNWITFRPAQYEGVQPLVKFCQHESGQASFGQSSAIPVTDEDSWAQNKTLGWNLYLMNPSSQVEPPKITVKLKGDANLEVALKELPNPALGDTPLVPPGSGTCPIAAPG